MSNLKKQFSELLDEFMKYYLKHPTMLEFDDGKHIAKPTLDDLMKWLKGKY